MLLTVFYQAPFQLLLPSRGHQAQGGDSKVRCFCWPCMHCAESLPHVVVQNLRLCACACAMRIAVQAACTLAHLLGLFRLDPGESLLSLGYRGALADVLLWGFTRIQTHMFASNTYDSVICVVQQEEQEEKKALEAEVRYCRPCAVHQQLCPLAAHLLP